MEIKKFIHSFSVMSMALALLSTACNQSETKMDEEPAGAATETVTGMKIAYVEVDSLMSQYNFCKEYTLILQKKSNNARNTLNQKAAQLQNAAANFQEKLQSNGFASREEAERVQMALQRQQQDLQELQNRLGSELDAETAKFNDALRDSLQNFLKVYNKSKKYDIILSKAGDNILYAAKKYDITQDVINGLNKRYKSTIKKEAEKK